MSTTQSTVTGQTAPYFCPQCRSNRVRFQVINKVSRPVHKDPRTGEVKEKLGEPHLVTKDGAPEIEVYCEVCSYTAGESLFTAAARNNPL